VYHLKTQKRIQFSGGSIVAHLGSLHVEKAQDTSAVLGKLKNAKRGIEIVIQF
jgi:hypothetical protein